MSTLRIAQEAHPKSEGWWEWAVWIEGAKDDLDRVEQVTWHLHPTFPRPVVTSEDRAKAFRLESSGWGEFTLKARVRRTDGETEQLRHHLELSPRAGSREAESRGAGSGVEEAGVEEAGVRAQDRPEDLPLSAPGRAAEAAPARPQPRRVFISHSFADADVADELRESLQAQGPDAAGPVEVVSPRSIGETLAQRIEDSDLVVALTSSASGQYVDLETRLARDKGKPVLRVDLDPELPTSKTTRVRGMTATRGGGVEEVADLASHLGRRLQVTRDRFDVADLSKRVLSSLEGIDRKR